MATVEKAITVKQESGVVAYVAEEFNDFFDDVVLTSHDFVIPRLKLIQSISKVVTNGEALPGEFRNNSNELIAANNKTVDVIILKLDKYWRSKQTTPEGKYLENGETFREPFTAENANLDWEFVREGKSFRRYITMDLYLSMAGDEDTVLRNMPMVLSLASSAYKTAKTLNTELQKMKLKGELPMQYVFTLGRKIEGAYSVPTLQRGRATTEGEQRGAAYWRNELRTQKVKIDGEETGDEA